MRWVWCVLALVAACDYAQTAPPAADAGDAAAIDAVIDAPAIDAPTDGAVIDAPIDAPAIDAPAIDAPAIDAAPIDAPAWTWHLTPTSVTSLLEDVWGTAPNNVYAVGQNGTILHWNGAAWSVQPAGTFLYLFGVWADPTRAWAVGDWGALVRKDGAGAWSASTAPSGTSIYYYGVWGASVNDVWAVGLDGHVLHHDGDQWTDSLQGTADFEAIHGDSATSIYAVGTGGAIWHFTGGSWSSENSTLISDLRGVAALPGGVAYAVGAGGKILRRNSGSWTQLTSPTTNGLFDVWASAAGIWVVGNNALVYYSDGSSGFAQITVPTTEDLHHVWVAANGEVFIVGTNGTALRYGP